MIDIAQSLNRLCAENSAVLDWMASSVRAPASSCLDGRGLEAWPSLMNDLQK